MRSWRFEPTRGMSKHKIVTHTHLPAPVLPPPAAPPSAPRLVAQLITVAGELMTVAVLTIGAVTVASWLIAGAEKRAVVAHPPPAVDSVAVLAGQVRRSL